MSDLDSRPPVSATAPPAEPDVESEPLPAQIPAQAGAGTDLAPPVSTTAGALLSGRYRLGTRVGSDLAAGAEFWQAEDTVLRRAVALTLLRRRTAGAEAQEQAADDPTGATRAGAMIVRALRSGAFEHLGCARLLDVLAPGASGMPDDVLGAAVTEWVPGSSLAEIVADGLLKPMAAARAVTPLAAAVEEAHRHGFVLGCDHPQRIRITPEGRARLCFALPRPDVRPADDVRGLGAVLFALLTARWPLSGVDAARAGLPAADRTAGGGLESPSVVRPGIPVELDTLAVGTLGPEGAPGHVHTAAAVHQLLTDVVAEDDRTALFPPEPDGLPSAPDDVWQDRNRPAPTADPRRRRKLVAGLLVLAVAVVLALGYVGSQLSSLFSDDGGPAIVVEAPAGPAPAQPGPAPAEPLRVVGVDVVDDVGDRDNAGLVARVVDGDPATAWRTFRYQQPFPAAKPGVGIMLTFASAVQLSGLTIDSPSPGTRIEVRSAPSSDAGVDDTETITTATLADGRTEVPLDGSQPVEHLLVWIVELGGGGSDNQTEINEIEFVRAGS